MTRIATFNANSIRSRLPVIADWLNGHRPDVLAVQETKCRDADFPRAEVESLGYQVVFRGEKSYNGVAVLSRQPPDEAEFGFDDGGPVDATRLAAVRFGALTLVNTYVPQGREITHEMFRYKIEWFSRLRRWFERRFRSSDLVAWVGDLNVAAEPEDVHAPDQYADHVCYHAAARAAFGDCRAWGFVDVFRKYHEGPGHYSFFDYRTPQAARRKLGWRLDYVLASPALAERSLSCAIDLAPRLAERPSDHTFVFADFEL